MTTAAHAREGLRLNHAADLDWFFNDRRGDMGYHAQNYDPDRWRGDSVDPDRYGVNRTAATQREMRVLLSLRELDAVQNRIISLAYSEHRWRGLERMGRAAGVAAWVYDKESVIDSALALASLSNQKGGDVYVRGYQEKAEALLRDTMAAYGAAAARITAMLASERAAKMAHDRAQAARMGVRWTAPVEDEE